MTDDWALPQIDMDRCTGCGMCETYCPTQAVDLVEGWPVIARPEDCAYCGLCEEACPENAIALTYEITPDPNWGGDHETTDR